MQLLVLAVFGNIFGNRRLFDSMGISPNDAHPSRTECPCGHRLSAHFPGTTNPDIDRSAGMPLRRDILYRISITSGEVKAYSLRRSISDFGR